MSFGKKTESARLSLFSNAALPIFLTVPCKRCGGTAQVLTSDVGMHKAVCAKCGNKTEAKNTLDEVIEAWNRDNGEGGKE